MKLKSDHRIRASTGFEPVTSAIPVRCSTNWAMKPHIGNEVNFLSSYLPVQWNDELFHINFTSFHCTGRYELNKLTSLPMCDFFQASSFQLLRLGKFTAMITLQFHLQPQYKYELFHINFKTCLGYSSQQSSYKFLKSIKFEANLVHARDFAWYEQSFLKHILSTVIKRPPQ